VVRRRVSRNSTNVKSYSNGMKNVTEALKRKERIFSATWEAGDVYDEYVVGCSLRNPEGKRDDKVQADQHQSLHVVGFSVLDERVHEEDGHE